VLDIDRVWVMQIGQFEKFHKVVFGQPSLLLQVTFGSHYEPLTRVVGFLTAVAIASHHGDAIGSVLVSLLATHSAFAGAFDGVLGGRSSATARGHSRVS
jgi:TctA family transporter